LDSAFRPSSLKGIGDVGRGKHASIVVVPSVRAVRVRAPDLFRVAYLLLSCDPHVRHAVICGNGSRRK
jgi:hypothetical protein